jgi:Arc/MetJ-type ribon-helix-helix transcriptional regulator
MEKATLTICLPRPMKDYIEAKLQEGRFSTPSEYLRSLIRDEQDMTALARQVASEKSSTMSQRVKRKR